MGGLEVPNAFTEPIGGMAVLAGWGGSQYFFYFFSDNS